MHFVYKGEYNDKKCIIKESKIGEGKDRYESADQMINLLNRIKDDVGKTEMNTKV